MRLDLTRLVTNINPMRYIPIVVALSLFGCGGTGDKTNDAAVPQVDGPTALDGSSADGPRSSADVAPDAEPQPVMMRVGPEGGEIRTEGLKIAIPAGALTTMMEVTVEPVDAPATPVETISRFFDFGPEGTKFAKPVTVTLDLLAPPGPGDKVAIYWSNAEGDYEEIDAQVTGMSATALVPHFSRGGGMLVNQLPSCASVKSTCGMECSCYANGSSLFLTETTAEGGGFKAWGDGEACMGYPFGGGPPIAGKTERCKFSEEPGFLCEVKVPRSRYPESYDHIKEVIDANPRKAILTLDKNEKRADERRRQALKAFRDRNPNFMAREKYDLDEYPLAMFAEGGSTADVKEIMRSDNRGSGSCIGKQTQGIPNVAPVKIVLVP